MYRRAFAILISVLALAGVAAGCGDEESSADSLTKAEFVQQAETVCKDIAKESRKKLQSAIDTQEGVPPAEQPDTKEVEEILITTIIVPALEQQVEELEKLGVPQGDQGEVDEILTAIDDLAEEAKDNPIGVSSQPDPFRESDLLMKAYGIESCRH